MAKNDILARLAVVISANAAEMTKGLNVASSNLKSFEKTVGGVQDSIKSLVGIGSFALIAKQIVDVTSEFQKFEAVLTNTLGSKSAAQTALENIKDFAAKTPFAVSELTSSFVKLANQGFVPTTNELRKLGDLASSTGKGFDQLTEAIIDAQVGEFERLKEFGVRAQKSGDQVKFTFKGVETQVKFTSDEIRNYVLSLGEAEGVSGSMEAISKTLGGQISNLGDAFENLLLQIGSESSGPLASGIQALTQITKVTANLGFELQLINASIGVRNLDDLSDSVKKYAFETAKIDGKKLVTEIVAPFEALSNQELFNGPIRATKLVSDALIAEGASAKEAAFLTTIFLERRAKAAEADAEAAKQARIDSVQKAKDQAEEYQRYLSSLGLIEALNIQIKELEQKKINAFSVGEIQSFNAQLDAAKEKLDLLNLSVPKTSFGKDIFNKEANTTKIEGPKMDQVSTGSLVNPITVESVIPDSAVASIQANFQKINDQYQQTGQLQISNSDQAATLWDLQIQKQQQAADAATQYGSAVGDALGSALSGQESFASAMKKLTADLLKTFLARALGGIIASAATSGGPPPVAIALAAAGVAAISAIFSKATGFSGGGGKATASIPKESVSNRSTSVSGASQNFQLKVSGNDLVAVVDSTNKNKGRTG